MAEQAAEAALVQDVLRHAPELWRLKQALQDVIVAKGFQPAQLRDMITEKMEASGQATFVRNLSFAVQQRLAFSSCLASSSREAELQYHAEEPMQDYAAHADLFDARDQLQVLASQRVRELQLLSDWPLARPRRTQLQLDRLAQQAQAATVWESIGNRNSPYLQGPAMPGQIRRMLLGYQDVLLILAKQMRDLSLSTPRGPSLAASGSPYRSSYSALPRSLGMVTFMPALRSLKAPTMDYLRAFLADLRPQQRHVGVDDRLHPWFREVKLQGAKALAVEGSIQLCRNFAKCGVPQGCRLQIWEAALGLSPLSDSDVHAFEALCMEVQQQQLVLDMSYSDDLNSVVDSEHFFLFEDMIRAVLLAFSRDPLVPRHCSIAPHPTVTIGPKEVSSEGSSTTPAGGGTSQLYPPCSVLPIQGLSLLVGPLCYLAEHPAAVYRLFRSMYCRHWCKLRSLSFAGLPAPALPLLCKAYEDLMQELEPELVHHIHQQLGCPILAVAFPWIYSAFVGFLPVEEVLLLWDRVLGLDSLLPIPLLAVAILSFRRQIVLSCQSSQEMLDVMSDLSQLKIVPLLQAVLFQG